MFTYLPTDISTYEVLHESLLLYNKSTPFDKLNLRWLNPSQADIHFTETNVDWLAIGNKIPVQHPTRPKHNNPVISSMLVNWHVLGENRIVISLTSRRATLLTFLSDVSASWKYEVRVSEWMVSLRHIGTIRPPVSILGSLNSNTLWNTTKKVQLHQHENKMINYYVIE